MALIIVLALSARLVVNIKRGVNQHKVKIEAAETNDGDDDKTEKDTYSESSAWIYHADTKNRNAIVSPKVKFYTTDFHFVLPRHFCAVPTPPPWA